MTIKSAKELHKRKIQIDLTGPDGNVFVLMGIVRKLARMTGKDGDALIKEMRSGDYDNAVYVLEREFGEVVDIYV